MRDRGSAMAEIEAVGVVAVVRASSGGSLLDVARALSAEGVTACEITRTTPGALDGIGAAARELSDSTLVGVGSVLDAETARAAILAGPSSSWLRPSTRGSSRWRTAMGAQYRGCAHPHRDPDRLVGRSGRREGVPRQPPWAEVLP